MIASRAVAGTPRSPTAKLMTRLERYTSTRPMAMSPTIIPCTTPMNSRLEVKMAPSTKSAAFGAEEHRPHQVVALEQVGGGPLEAYGPLVEEDGAIGDGERHIERLLHDHHGLALVLEPLDHRQQALDDDGGEPQRKLVDQQDLGLVQK